MRVCLKCGAVSDGLVCEYCRAPFTENESGVINATVNNLYAPAQIPVAPVLTPAPQAAVIAPQQMISGKNWWTTLLLCFFIGIFGAHRFYTGKIGTGVIWLFTLGCFAYGWIIDVILILTGKFKDKQGRQIMRL